MLPEIWSAEREITIHKDSTRIFNEKNLQQYYQKTIFEMPNEIEDEGV